MHRLAVSKMDLLSFFSPFKSSKNENNVKKEDGHKPPPSDFHHNYANARNEITNMIGDLSTKKKTPNLPIFLKFTNASYSDNSLSESDGDIDDWESDSSKSGNSESTNTSGENNELNKFKNIDSSNGKPPTRSPVKDSVISSELFELTRMGILESDIDEEEEKIIENITHEVLEEMTKQGVLPSNFPTNGPILHHIPSQQSLLNELKLKEKKIVELESKLGEGRIAMCCEASTQTDDDFVTYVTLTVSTSTSDLCIDELDDDNSFRHNNDSENLTGESRGSANEIDYGIISQDFSFDNVNELDNVDGPGIDLDAIIAFENSNSKSYTENTALVSSCNDDKLTTHDVDRTLHDVGSSSSTDDLLVGKALSLENQLVLPVDHSTFEASLELNEFGRDIGTEELLDDKSENPVDNGDEESSLGSDFLPFVCNGDINDEDDAEKYFGQENIDFSEYVGSGIAADLFEVIADDMNSDIDDLLQSSNFVNDGAVDERVCSIDRLSHEKIDVFSKDDSSNEDSDSDSESYCCDDNVRIRPLSRRNLTSIDSWLLSNNHFKMKSSLPSFHFTAEEFEELFVDISNSDSSYDRNLEDPGVICPENEFTAPSIEPNDVKMLVNEVDLSSKYVDSIDNVDPILLSPMISRRGLERLNSFVTPLKTSMNHLASQMLDESKLLSYFDNQPKEFLIRALIESERSNSILETNYQCLKAESKHAEVIKSNSLELLLENVRETNKSLRVELFALQESS